MLKLAKVMLFSIVSVASLSAQEHSASINITKDVQAGTTSIAAGVYSLHWSVESGDTNLSIANGKHQYTVPVTVKAGTPKGGDAVLSRNEGDQNVLEGFKVSKQLLMVR